GRTRQARRAGAAPRGSRRPAAPARRGGASAGAGRAAAGGWWRAPRRVGDSEARQLNSEEDLTADSGPPERTKTAAQLRDDIDKGRTGDKIDWPDPAAAPSGTGEG